MNKGIQYKHLICDFMVRVIKNNTMIFNLSFSTKTLAKNGTKIDSFLDK